MAMNWEVPGLFVSSDAIIAELRACDMQKRVTHIPENTKPILKEYHATILYLDNYRNQEVTEQ